jgi:hypothetical protein
LEDGMLISFSLTGDFTKGGAIVPKFAILEKIVV